MYSELGLYIDGAWKKNGGGGKSEEVINPATGAALGELPLANAADLDRALEAAERGYRKWRATPAEERGQVMKRAAGLIRERSERIARIATLEEGKTLAETRIETQVAANLFEFYGEECRRSYGRVLVRPAGRRSLVVKEPVGPVAAFAPWNFPITNPARKLGAPVAAGCSVILKPAEEAPGAALEILRALLDAGLPAGVAQIVFGVPDEVSRHLLASPVVRKLSFTGSIAVGKHLMRLAADNMLRTTMELGGHAPVLIFDDADLEKALDELTAAKLRNAGQVCISPTRFYVQEGVYDPFVKGLTEYAKGVKVGDGLEKGIAMGPLANSRRLDAMDSFVADAKARGGKIATGGSRRANQGYFYEPTVITDVPDDSKIMTQEPVGRWRRSSPSRPSTRWCSAPTRWNSGLRPTPLRRRLRPPPRSATPSSSAWLASTRSRSRRRKLRSAASRNSARQRRRHRRVERVSRHQVHFAGLGAGNRRRINNTGG